jgi:hypothetical protein
VYLRYGLQAHLLLLYLFADPVADAVADAVADTLADDLTNDSADFTADFTDNLADNSTDDSPTTWPTTRPPLGRRLAHHLADDSPTTWPTTRPQLGHSDPNQLGHSDPNQLGHSDPNQLGHSDPDGLANIVPIRMPTSTPTMSGWTPACLGGRPRVPTAVPTSVPQLGSHWFPRVSLWSLWSNLHCKTTSTFAVAKQLQHLQLQNNVNICTAKPTSTFALHNDLNLQLTTLTIEGLARLRSELAVIQVAN